MPKLRPRALSVEEIDASIDAMDSAKLREFAKGMVRGAHRYETVAYVMSEFIAGKTGRRLPKVDPLTVEIAFPE